MIVIIAPKHEKLPGVAGDKPNRYFHLPKSMKSAIQRPWEKGP